MNDKLKEELLKSYNLAKMYLDNAKYMDAYNEFENTYNLYLKLNDKGALTHEQKVILSQFFDVFEEPKDKKKLSDWSYDDPNFEPDLDSDFDLDPDMKHIYDMDED